MSDCCNLRELCRIQTEEIKQLKAKLNDAPLTNLLSPTAAVKTPMENKSYPGPSRELDALIAEKVMGCKVKRYQPSPEVDIFICTCEDNPGKHGQHEGQWRRMQLHAYSTDIAAAWEVVEKINQSPDWSFGLVFNGVEWIAGMGAYSEDHEVKDYWRFIFHGVEANAHTAPHAICLAALKAVEK